MFGVFFWSITQLTSGTCFLQVSLFRFILLGVLMNGGGLHFMSPTSFFFMWWGTGGEVFRPKIAQTIIPVLKIFEIVFG
jgi:hypothetical protein